MAQGALSGEAAEPSAKPRRPEDRPAVVNLLVHGADLMGHGHELGRVADGYLADLLVVNGDPSRDVTLLQDPANLVGIMKGGAWHKEP